MNIQDSTNESIFSDILLILISVFMLIFLFIFIINPLNTSSLGGKDNLKNKTQTKNITSLNKVEYNLNQNIANWHKKIQNQHNQLLKYKDYINREYSIFRNLNTKKNVLVVKVVGDKYYIENVEFTLSEINHIERSIVKGNGFEIIFSRQNNHINPFSNLKERESLSPYNKQTPIIFTTKTIQEQLR